MNNVFSFGKSKAKMFSSNRKKVKFSDVAGCIEAKEELEEVIEKYNTKQNSTYTTYILQHLVFCYDFTPYLDPFLPIIIHEW